MVTINTKASQTPAEALVTSNTLPADINNPTDPTSMNAAIRAQNSQDLNPTDLGPGQTAGGALACK